MAESDPNGQSGSEVNLFPICHASAFIANDPGCPFFHLILGKLTARLQESLGRLIAYIILLGQWPPKNSNSQVAMALILSLVHDE